MATYLLRRLLQFIPTLLAVAILVFFMLELIPGDIVALLLGMEASQEAMADMRHDLGLDRPVTERFLQWFTNVLRGDLGRSIFLDVPVTDLLKERYTITASMAVFSLLGAVIFGLSAGILAALNQGKLIDWAIMMVALLGFSVPVFWVGLNLIYLFGVKLRWLPIGGYVSWSESPIEFVRHMILPCIPLAFAYAAIIARVTRTSMLEVLRMDYIRTAKAKGLKQSVVVIRHAFRNALIPIITVVGMGVGWVLGGSVVTETVFNLRGVGRLIVDSVLRRDYIILQGSVLAVTVVYLVVNLGVDLLYALIDPRISVE